jgi:hypothetical protein
MSSFVFIPRSDPVVGLGCGGDSVNKTHRARVVHLLGAAVCWLFAVLIWIVRVIPKAALRQRE